MRKSGGGWKRLPVLVLAPVAVFADRVARGWTLAPAGDAYARNLPLHLLAFRAWRHGHLPAWNFSKYVVDKQGRITAFFPSGG